MAVSSPVLPFKVMTGRKLQNCSGPPDEKEKVKIHARSASGMKSDVWVVSNRSFWRWHSLTSLLRNYVFAHTFVLPVADSEEQSK